MWGCSIPRLTRARVRAPTHLCWSSLRLQAGAKLPIYGPGTAMRSFLYVKDCADAFDRILHAGADGTIYNISTALEKSVLQVAGDLCRQRGVALDDVAIHTADRLYNDSRYNLTRTAPPPSPPPPPFTLHRTMHRNSTALPLGNPATPQPCIIFGFWRAGRLAPCPGWATYIDVSPMAPY